MVEPVLFGSQAAFEHKYLRTVQVRTGAGRAFRKVVGYADLDDLRRRVALVSLRRTKAECLDLPPRVRQSRDCPMAPAQWSVYETARDEGRLLLRRYERGEVDEREFRVSAEALLTRLCQVGDGYASPRAGLAGWFPEHGKVAVLDDLLEEVVGQGRKAVLWTRFRPPVEALAERYAAHGAVFIHGGVGADDRQAALERFAGEEACRVFVGQVDAAGLGVNLQAGSCVVFYDLPWTPAIFSQALDRCHRIGQTRTVDVVDLQATDPEGGPGADAAVAAKLARKLALAAQVTERPEGEAAPLTFTPDDLRGLLES